MKYLILLKNYPPKAGNTPFLICHHTRNIITAGKAKMRMTDPSPSTDSLNITPIGTTKKIIPIAKTTYENPFQII